MTHNSLKPNFASWRKPGLLLPVLLLLQALALGLNPNGTAKAEGFSDPAFQSQWNQTDQAVANGQVSRTYFWGPQPFAHTSEVYAESPNNGQREVQYFDKARMELNKKAGQDTNLVTNGLLTIELVTGQMQVGDNQFLQRSPATNPVAGDQLGNGQTPTYASFNKGKLAFGVPGATKWSDRTGQAIQDAVDVNGQIFSVQGPVNLKNARYFNETGHNVADVFNNFFQAAPLGEDKWLAVMGYPITEAFWSKEKVTVGGQPRDVLIQLFQRRALTYTPSNPAGFQVEMGNIGQHYYVWRYGFDTRDQLPGNYRLVTPVGNALYSTNIRKPSDKINLGSAPSTITGLWALNEGRAVVATSTKVYLADLTKARAFKEIPLPAVEGLNLGNLVIYDAAGSPDGLKVALSIGSLGSGKHALQVYRVDTMGGDNLNITSNYTAVTTNEAGILNLAFSADSRYLAVSRETGGLIIADTTQRQSKSYDLLGQAYWLGKTGQLMVTSWSTFKYDGPSNTYKPDVPGKINVVDAASGSTTKIAEGPYIRQAIPSPGGNYFALRQSEPGTAPLGSGDLIKSFLTFRSIADPTKDLTPAFEQGTSGRNSTEPRLVGWNSDGTIVQISSFANFTAGANRTDNSFVSLANGKDLKKVSLEGSYMSVQNLSLVAALYILKATHTYNGPNAPSGQNITLQNFDNSEQTVLFSGQVTPNLSYNDTTIRLAQVVQVPVVNK